MWSARGWTGTSCELGVGGVGGDGASACGTGLGIARAQRHSLGLGQSLEDIRALLSVGLTWSCPISLCQVLFPMSGEHSLEGGGM